MRLILNNKRHTRKKFFFREDSFAFLFLPTPMFTRLILVCNALVWPILSVFVFFDFIGVNTYQGLFGAVAFTFFVALLLLAQYIIYFYHIRFPLEENPASVQRSWNIRAWMLLLTYDFVVMAVCMWCWYGQYSETTGSAANIKFPIDQPVMGFVDWNAVQLYVLGSAPLHAIAFGNFWVSYVYNTVPFPGKEHKVQ